MVDGKTYYYLYDTESKTIHVCSDGRTLCELDTVGFEELNLPEGVSTSSLSSTAYKLCDKCANYKEPKKKKATFEVKAEMIDPAKEEQYDLE